MADNSKDGGGFQPAVAAVARHLEGLDFLDADRVLDDARRITWVKVFSGADDAAVQDQVKASERALRIAVLCHGLDVFEVEHILTETRFWLFIQNFARLPETAFGKQAAAHVERADLPDEKLN